MLKIVKEYFGSIDEGKTVGYKPNAVVASIEIIKADEDKKAKLSFLNELKILIPKIEASAIIGKIYP